VLVDGVLVHGGILSPEQGAQTSCQIGGLICGSAYSIEVVSVSGSDRSCQNQLLVLNTTGNKPLTQLDVIVGSITATSLQLGWSPATTNSSYNLWQRVRPHSQPPSR